MKRKSHFQIYPQFLEGYRNDPYVLYLISLFVIVENKYDKLHNVFI